MRPRENRTARLCSHPLREKPKSNRQGGSVGMNPPPSRPAGVPGRLVLPGPTTCPPASPACGAAGSRSLDSATLGAVRTEEVGDLAPFEEKTLQEDSWPCLDLLLAQADPVSKCSSLTGGRLVSLRLPRDGRRPAEPFLGLLSCPPPTGPPDQHMKPLPGRTAALFGKSLIGAGFLQG